MNDPKEKNDKDGNIPSGIPESAFDDALKAVEEIREAAKKKPKKKKPKKSASGRNVVQLDSEKETAELEKLMQLLEEAEESKPSPEPKKSKGDPSDLDLLAKILQEEQSLEKEAEFLKSVLVDVEKAARDEGAGPGPEEIKKKEKHIEQLQERLVRIQADFENFKKRINRDKEEMVLFSNENLILSVLPIIDNFERAISHAAATRDPQAMIDGVQLILKQLHDTLAANGVRKIDATTQVFDPKYHEAMASVESDEVEPGYVMAQYEPGYLLYQRLLRPARVVVASKNGESEVPEPKAEAE